MLRTSLGFGLFALLASTSIACAAKNSSDPDPGPLPTDDTGANTDGGFNPDSSSTFDVSEEVEAILPCKNLQCKQVKCATGTTSVSGTVYAPTPTAFGPADPLYNVIVYVPNTTPDPFPAGVSCDKCGALASGEPVVTTLTDYKGHFTLENMPVGTDIPLVIQVGKWRRQVVIPEVKECVDTPLSKEMTRLPRNKKEGDIPLMAIASSVYDPTECIMRKIGLDDSEFTNPTGTGRVRMYKVGGASIDGSTPPGNTLWNSLTELKKYDIVAFPCYSVASGPELTTAGKNVFDYASAGGRVYVTDLAHPWISQGPAPWPGTAVWGSTGFVSSPLPATVDTTFPKGKALADWLQYIKATTTLGALSLNEPYDRFSKVVAPSQRWIYSASDTQTYSFNTPVGKPAESQCGRVVYSSFHIASKAFGTTYPGECTAGPLTQQEKVLEFMLFDLASCVQKDTDKPVPPPPVR